ncbi:MAG: hypothetical protein ACI9FB_001742 [Candidatus Azotimanducaceae bacterium]|jgi:hypothetical protein
MHVFEMVAIIVTVSVIAGVVNSYIKTKAETAKIPADNQNNDRLEQLEERIRVLERVITDDRHQLKSQIDDLS